MPNIDLNGDGDNPSPDGTFTSPMCQSDTAPIERPSDGIWTPIVLNDVVDDGENYTCGNGEAYKFFVQYNAGATDLTIALEPGGACWDYETCNYEAGVLNPVRLNSVPDDLMTNIDEKPWAAMYPHLGRIDNSVATNKYNHVFFPYCTGDAFTASVENEYTRGSDSITVKHHGHKNLKGASKWLAQTFPSGSTGQLLVIGSSAGAVGAVTNYSLLRDTIAPKCGAMVSDAGPVFPPSGGQSGGAYPPYTPSPQEHLLDMVGDAWDLRADGGIVQELDNRFGNNWYRLLNDHFGHINRGLARAYPNDRFMFTTFKQDLNFSIFSFVSDGPIAPGDDIADEVLDMWAQEVDHFKQWADNDSKQNWGYYLPNYRPDYCSHMVATAPLTLVNDTWGYAMDGIEGHANGYQRTEIGDEDFGDALRQLLDPSQPVPRMEDAPEPSELSFLSDPGATSSSGTWYELWSGNVIQDKQAHVDEQRVSCVNTNGYTPSN